MAHKRDRPPTARTTLLPAQRAELGTLWLAGDTDSVLKWFHVHDISVPLRLYRAMIDCDPHDLAEAEPDVMHFVRGEPT